MTVGSVPANAGYAYAKVIATYETRGIDAKRRTSQIEPFLRPHIAVGAKNACMI